MTGGTSFLERLGELGTYRSKFASDPIHLSIHTEADMPMTSEDNLHSTMLPFLRHQNSIAVYENARNERAFWAFPNSASRQSRGSATMSAVTQGTSATTSRLPHHRNFQIWHPELSHDRGDHFHPYCTTLESRDDDNGQACRANDDDDDIRWYPSPQTSWMDDDLIVSRSSFAQSHYHEDDTESIEIINVSSLRE